MMLPKWKNTAKGITYYISEQGSFDIVLALSEEQTELSFSDSKEIYFNKGTIRIYDDRFYVDKLTNVVGYVVFSRLKPNDSVSLSTLVSKKYRKQGIASSMYAIYENKLKRTIVPSIFRTKDGLRLWGEK